MKYVGQMRTAFLNDQQIHSTDCRRWDDTEKRFRRRPKDWAIVTNLMETIPTQGLRVPIQLGVDDHYHTVFVADGHHRAIALKLLGVPEFSFHWYWYGWRSVHFESEPFPYHLLDSTRAV